MPAFSFPKKDRLKSHKDIQRLFVDGKTLQTYPLRLVYITQQMGSNDFVTKFAFSIPKKNIPKAVHRNKLKRQLKEIHRLNRIPLHTFLSKEKLQMKAMLIYTTREKLSFNKLEDSYVQLIQKLMKKL